MLRTGIRRAPAQDPIAGARPAESDLVWSLAGIEPEPANLSLQFNGPTVSVDDVARVGDHLLGKVRWQWLQRTADWLAEHATGRVVLAG